MEFNPNKWPMRDVVAFEEKTGETTATVFVKGRMPSALEQTVIYWIARKQDEPGFTFEDAENTPWGEVAGAMAANVEAMKANGSHPLPEAGIPNIEDGSRRSRNSTATRRRNSGV
jgi:hypothetical protein